MAIDIESDKWQRDRTTVLRLRTKRTQRTLRPQGAAQKPAQTIPLTERLITPAIKAFFWSRVKIGDGCWEWAGSLDGSSGYGRLRGHGSRRTIRAHRVSWFIEHGEDPGEMLVCHTCDNPTCVNPDHLFLGTVADNTHDMMRKGRDQTIPMPGSRNPRAKLTEFDARRVIEMIGAGHSNRHIAKLLPVSDAMVSKIRMGHAWHDLAQAMGYTPRPSRLAPKSGRTKAAPNRGFARKSKRQDW